LWTLRFFLGQNQIVVALPALVSLTDGNDVHTAFSDLQATTIHGVNGVFGIYTASPVSILSNPRFSSASVGGKNDHSLP
jgi:hypothetical protein